MTTTVVRRPLVLGLGGTLRPGSSSERALRAVLAAVERRGAAIELLTANELDLPMYDQGRPRHSGAQRLVAAARAADAVVIASPGYHGGMSGLLKNALDHLQELADDERPYLDGRAVGCVVTAAGWQAAATTLGSLRDTVHALRGWPTPLGVVVNTAGRSTFDSVTEDRFDALAAQVMMFVNAHRAVAA